MGFDGLWQDREIGFDIPVKELDPRPGEYQIDSINNIEDTKGNNGERGMLIVTNLRLVWVSHKSAKINLSVGFDSVQSLSIKTAQSKLRGTVQALYVMAKSSSRFEFVFTNLVKGSPRLFTTVQSVYRAYDTSRLYRDLKLRGAIVRDKQIILLPKEEVVERIGGVYNLSSEQGNLGTFFITNVRVVWFANLAENFNVSIPYLQMQSIRTRQSKFGLALVIETSTRSGGYILGFHCHPVEKLQELCLTIQKMHQVFSVRPMFGVEYEEQDAVAQAAGPQLPRVDDDVEVVEHDMHDLGALYASEAFRTAAKREPEYNTQLGLAVEKLPAGFTVQQLWEGGLTVED